jgi:hypothetical protein
MKTARSPLEVLSVGASWFNWIVRYENFYEIASNWISLKELVRGAYASHYKTFVKPSISSALQRSAAAARAAKLAPSLQSMNVQARLAVFHFRKKNNEIQSKNCFTRFYQLFSSSGERSQRKVCCCFGEEWNKKLFPAAKILLKGKRGERPHLPSRHNHRKRIKKVRNIPFALQVKRTSGGEMRAEAKTKMETIYS